MSGNIFLEAVLMVLRLRWNALTGKLDVICPADSPTARLKVWSWTSRRPRNAWLVLLLLTVVLRLPYLLDDRQVNDESYYSTVGIEVLDGGQPYVSAVDRKPTSAVL